jgi:hypothetical protein
MRIGNSDNAPGPFAYRAELIQIRAFIARLPGIAQVFSE